MPRDGFVTTGDQLPIFDLADLDGVRRPLLAEPGRKFLIFMWASW